MLKRIRRSRTARWVLGAVVFGAVAAGVIVLVLRRGPSEPQMPPLPVFVNHGERQVEVDLLQLPRETWRVAYQGPALAPGDENWKISHIYSGVRLSDVLAAIDPLAEGDMISAVAGDGWAKALPTNVLSGETEAGEIMLALSREGGDTDPWDDAPMLVFAPPDGVFSNRDMLLSFGPDLAHYHAGKPSTMGFLVKSVLYLIVNYDGRFPGLPSSESESIVEETAGAFIDLVKGGETRRLECEDLKAMTTITGAGTFTNSIGEDHSATYTGVPLASLIGNVSTDATICVTASDGYAMNYEAGMVLDRSEGTWILAYYENGEPLDESKGPFRIVLVGENNPDFESALSAKMVRQIEILGTYEEYTLLLAGAVERLFARGELEAGVGCSCHTATVSVTSKGETKTYTGIPLWRLLGWVDDEVFPVEDLGIHYDDEDFNDTLAAGAYTITLLAADGYSQSVTSDLIARDDRFIVAFKADGVFLDAESNGYMRFVYDSSVELPEGVSLKSVKSLAEIHMDLP